VDASTVVAEVVDLERLAVTTKIPEARADQVKVGEPVQLDRRPGDASVTATISYVSPIVNANDGTVSAWAALPPNSGLRPGQFVPLKIVVATHTNCLAAPAASVVTDVGGQSVIALVRGDEAVQLPVPTGFRENDWVEIVSPDLKPGDSVVTVGAYGLPQQTKIQIANSPDETPADKSPEAK
jgi:multidrug efflux pump subunit AcrA (membrane-fusion protein)